ncbi:MAG TPA: GNAT family protein [Tangfeifania sp.]|nr:GNAT family protein [Tangfeifania sp.]
MNSAKKIIGTDGYVALRELIDTDLPKMAKYANNKKVSINLRDAFPNPYTVDDAKRFFKMVNEQDPKTFLAIEYQGEYVGNISLLPGSDVYRKSAEIGYFIGEPFWNKGIATRAVKLITKFGFEKLGIVRIYTGIFEFNKASQRVLEKCGFQKEAVFKDAIFKNGKLHNEVRFAKLKRNNQK